MFKTLTNFLVNQNLISLLSGCFLNGFVDWKWACKTNTLGWEQCDVMKRKEMKEKAKILEKHFKPSDSGSIKEQH